MSANKDNYRYRVYYARFEIAAWIAHLDLMRVFQRASKRADLPLVYTQGFNPRPIMEFALPIGVGIETRNEPFDFLLSQKMNIEDIKNNLNAKLPNGLEIVRVESLSSDVKNLMSLVNAAEYQISADGLGTVVKNYYFDNSNPLFASRERKGKIREYQIRDYIIKLKIIDNNTVTYISKAGSAENLRPDLFLQAFIAAKQISEETALNAIIIRKNVYLTEEKICG